MPKAAAKPGKKPPAENKSLAMVKFAPETSTLVHRIQTDVTNVTTEELVTFYTVADLIGKRLTELNKGIIRTEMIARREQGEPSGDEKKHRDFSFGPCSMQVQARRNWDLNVARAQTLLLEKKLWNDSISLEVTGGVPALQKFLHKHRKELKDMGIEITETLDVSKLEALVKLGQLTAAEVDSLYDKHPDEYALTKIKVQGLNVLPPPPPTAE